MSMVEWDTRALSVGPVVGEGYREVKVALRMTHDVVIIGIALYDSKTCEILASQRVDVHLRPVGDSLLVFVLQTETLSCDRTAQGSLYEGASLAESQTQVARSTAGDRSRQDPTFARLLLDMLMNYIRFE